MININLQSPEIRFSDFYNKWGKKELGEISEINPSSELPDIFEYIDLESVSGTTILAHRTEKKVTAPSRAQRLAQKGDIFYQTVRPYQKNNCLYDLPYDNYVFSTGYAQIRSEHNRYFLFSYLQRERFISTVLKLCTGTSYPSINTKDLSKIKINFPDSIKEQDKIGDLFKYLDEVMTLQQQLLNDHKQLKKAMLQKMFPQKGETVPRVRFPNFTDSWEQRNFLDNINSIIDFRGRTPKKIGLSWSASGYLALSALNVKNGYIDYYADAHYGDKNLYDKWMGGRELKEGQVLFTMEAPMGNVAQVPDNKGYILSQRTVAFNVEESKMTNDFLSILLRSPKVFKELTALSSGGTAKGISQRSLSQLNVKVPIMIEEQTKIGNFFKQLDETIALHENKLETYQELKKAMLQKMFV
ncbi:restriction endonuclease subunit S [Carnobacterium funditum]|uniref:restriction endonuclease subunit S n=1 Tax=Carnobacterium funditum TaxID=2752 RepID=UPI000558C5CE|nr:restriction endonuclease subunit S [Carnobacterium funditum]